MSVLCNKVLLIFLDVDFSGILRLKGYDLPLPSLRRLQICVGMLKPDMLKNVLSNLVSASTFL